MSHKTTTTHSSSTKVKYSAYTGTDVNQEEEEETTEQRVLITPPPKYVVKNYTKTPVIENPAKDYNPMQSRTPVGNWGYTVTEVEEETKLQWFVKAFLKVGARIKDRIRAFFRFKKRK